jgi:hypothetical protein
MWRLEACCVDTRTEGSSCAGDLHSLDLRDGLKVTCLSEKVNRENSAAPEIRLELDCH